MECPCGSEKSYEECCHLFHNDSKKPETALQLMKSRYSAFATDEIDYIIDTHHKKTSAELDKEAITNWAKDSKWVGLEIVSTELGGPADSTGVVEFKAKYSLDGKAVIHHERSNFKKVGEQWFYYDGKLFNSAMERTTPKIGRNDPCLCGSGKKFKKCCL